MQTPRYGASNRKLVDKAIKAKKTRYECPKCKKYKLVRKGNALWNCKGCDGTFAGGAYSFSSESGEIAKRLVAEYSKSS
ncbi:MAG: 50S ribosomal protein L37ae [Candidatus Micrarchaeota archaeon]|nr:50S ribosomal protein L37ae [Candidatus Micrarchaeota archaeon]MBU1682177.1 50S ribosomal protein L37ae [Candidatus Micrarchaeota archaeon]